MDMDFCSLTGAELESLRELTRGSVRRRIDSSHAVKLVRLGFARETADGVLITNLGRAHLAMHLPRHALSEDESLSYAPRTRRA